MYEQITIKTPEVTGTHHVLAVLIRDVLLQTLLAAEQLVTFITFKQLITWKDARRDSLMLKRRLAPQVSQKRR